jgi:transcriptional regulator with XRE-family HTH domain
VARAPRKTEPAEGAKYADVGRRLHALREALALSQQALAERGGLHRTDIVALEKGIRGASTARIREGYAKATGLDLETIGRVIDGSEDPVEALARLKSRRDERSPRYPNAELAVEEMGAKWDDGTVTDLRTFAFRSPTDLSVDTWISIGNQIQRAKRSGQQIGRPLPDEDDTPPAGR